MLTAAQLLGAAKAKVDFFRQLLTDAMSNGILVTSWMKGSPTVEAYDGAASTFATFAAENRAIANQGFLSTATGDGKTAVAKQVYGVTRPGATYATTTIQVTNAGGGNYPYSANNPIIVLASGTKKQYVSQGSGTIGPLAVGVNVDVRALEPGSSYTALPGTIDTFVTPLDGCSISQGQAAIGTDQMSDVNLEAACTARVGYVPTASTIGAGGAPGAYESVARAGPDGGGGVLRPDGTRISVTRVRVLTVTDGAPWVFVADDDGPLDSGDFALVEAALLKYALPQGIGTATVLNAAAQSITVTYTIFVPSTVNTSDSDIEAAALDALTSYLTTVPIGGFDLGDPNPVVPQDGIRGAIRRGVEALLGASATVSVNLTLPAADVVISANNRVPVLAAAPTVTVTRVPGY